MKKITVFFFCIRIVAAKGQILNIDRAGQDSLSAGKFRTQLAVSIDLDEQKKDVFDADGNMDLTYQGKRNTLIMTGGSEYVYNGKDDILNSGSLQLRDREWYTRPVHPELFIQYQWDAVKGLKERFLTGANARFLLREIRHFRMFAGTGFMYEYERWGYEGVINKDLISPNAPEVTRRLIKSTSYLRISKSLGGKLDFSIVGFYQAQPEYFFKYPRIAEFMQLNYVLNSHFSIALEYDSIYDTKPVVPIKKYYFGLNQSLLFRM